jgi:hypothetical protein
MLLPRCIANFISILIVQTPHTQPSGDKAQLPSTSPAPATKHIAPYVCNWPPAQVIPKHFEVHLAPGHSLQQHSLAIEEDITPFVHGQVSGLYGSGTVYLGHMIDDDLLRKIREDENVTYVECNYISYRPSLSA